MKTAIFSASSTDLSRKYFIVYSFKYFFRNAAQRLGDAKKKVTPDFAQEFILDKEPRYFFIHEPLKQYVII